jgi:hypothetical protein
MKTFNLATALLVMCMFLAFNIQAQEKANGTATRFNNSVYISQSIPGNMNSGQIYNVSVSMKNSGESVWRQGNYTLKLTNLSESYLKTWDISSVDVNSTVNNGDVIVFNFAVTAPLNEGNYSMQWQMADGNSYFGEPTVTAPVVVSGLTVREKETDFINTNSKFVTQNVQSEMDAGQTYDVTVIMKNTGSTTWKPGDYKLKVSTKGGDNTGDWSVANVELSGDVYPNSEVTFNFKVTAPAKDGTYNFQCQTVKEGKYFGEPTTNVIVKVN